MSRQYDKKWCIKHWKRLVSLGLAAALTITQFPTAAIGSAAAEAGREILSFAALPEEIQMQEVSVGTSIEELHLPKKLKAEIAVLEEKKEEAADSDRQDRADIKKGTPSDADEVTDVPEQETENTVSEKIVSVSVDWDSDPGFDGNTPGAYLFTAEPKNGYWFSGDVEVPTITVTVLPQTDQKTILSWTWNDPEQYVSENVLTLSGVNIENSIDFDTLVSLLPSSIETVLEYSRATDSDLAEDTTATVKLKWSSRSFKKNAAGNWPVDGSYLFTAVPEHGYILAEDAPDLEITVLLGGAQTLPADGIFSKLQIRAGTANGNVVVDLLDPTSVAENWQLKPGSDYYVYVELTAPDNAEHIQIRYGHEDGSYSGATFANVPGASYAPGDINTHDYFDALTAYDNFAEPGYGSPNKEFSLQDGEMVYHIKPRAGAAEKNTVFAIGLIVKDAVYDGQGEIPDAVSIAVGSYEDNTFTAAQDGTQSFDLKIAEKGKFASYMGNTAITAAIGEAGTITTTAFLGNMSQDTPEILYEQVEFDLTYPTKAELYIGSAELNQELGVMEIGEAAEDENGKTKTVHVTVNNGLKIYNKNGACIVRLDFPQNAGFNPGEKYDLVLSNAKLKMGENVQDIAIRSGMNKTVYTLYTAGRDETTLTGRDRTVYNHTIDSAAGTYIVPMGTAVIVNGSGAQSTPYEKTFEAQYNVTNTAANVSFITVPKGTNETPEITWTGVDSEGRVKNGKAENPPTGGSGVNAHFILNAADFGLVSFTGVTAEIGMLPANFNSAKSSGSWIFADNASSAFGYFTTDEPGIQVVSNYRLYNTDPALRGKVNGDLSATAKGTSTDRCAMGWTGTPKLNNSEFLSTSSVNADTVASITGTLGTYTAPQSSSYKGNFGNSQIAMEPVLYLTLPQGMTVVESEMKFQIDKRNLTGKKMGVTNISHKIENVSYLNTTKDGVSIYKITFQKGTRIGCYDGDGNSHYLVYTIPLLPSKSLSTRRYLLSEMITVADVNQPSACIRQNTANGAGINYVSEDIYGINGGNSLGTISMGTDENPTGFGVQQSAEVNLYSAVAVTKINGERVPEERWYSYSSDPNSIALLGKNSEGRLRLQVSNTSDTPGTSLRIILPIPRQGIDMGDVFMDAPSGFSMSMRYDGLNSDAGFSAKYIKVEESYDSIGDTTNLVSYRECTQEEADAVLLTSDSVAKGEYYIYLDFTVTNGTPKAIDIWRPVYAYTVKQLERRASNGSYVASEVAASSISGVAFADVNRNGIKDAGEDGAADITVVARDEKNRIVSTKTDSDGKYQFLAIRESQIDMSFTLSAEGQKMLRFNIPALPDRTGATVSTVIPSTDGLSASKTFLAAAGEEKVHAAVDGFASLSYNANGASGNLPKTSSYVKGTQATISVKPDNLSQMGYTFKHWNTQADGGGTAFQPGAKITVSQNTTLYAIWNIASYTVTFNYRGATGGNDEAGRTLQHNTQYGSVKKLPTPTKNGYLFKGWTTATTGTASDVIDTSLFTLGADTTLYALWEPNNDFKVNYNVDGGSGSIPEKTVNWESAVLPTGQEATAIMRNGYRLKGWTYSDAVVTASDTYGGLAETDSVKSITLTAEWQAKTGYTVRYNLAGGYIESNTDIPAKTNVSWTQSGLLPAKNPTKDSFSFTGWKYGSNMATGISTYGDIAKDDTTMDIMLTAQWEERNENTVLYDTSGGSPIPEKTGVKSTDTNLLPTENTIKPGYKLTGWKADGNEAAVDTNTAYSALSTVDTLTLVAQWEKKKYTITYAPGNGSTIPDAPKAWGDNGLLPMQPGRTGYVFDGWYFDGEKVTSAATVSALIPEDLTDTIPLAAKWNERAYIVIYDSQGGTQFTPKANVKYTAAGLLPDVSPTKTGYTFKGWYHDTGEVKAGTNCGSLLSDDTVTSVTLTARWEPKSGFTVQYDTDGGKPAPAPQIVAWEAAKLLPADTITKSGYKFKGWLSGRTTVTDGTVFSALASSDQPGTSVTLVAQWEEKGYIIAYQPDNGTSVSEVSRKWTESGLLPATEPKKSGYTFEGWFYESTQVTPAMAVSALIPNDDKTTLTLTAHWEQLQTDTPDISGEVTDENDVPIADAQVRLTQGAETIYGPVITESSGSYLFTGVKPGIYNLVAQKGDQTVTKIITVADRNLTENLKISDLQKNSVLEVVGTDTPAVVVGNLDQIAKNTPLNSGQSSLTITLTVKKEAEQEPAKELEHKAIRNAAGQEATILYLDAALMRQFDNNQPENIGNSNNVVLEVVIPYDFTGKQNVHVYRYHGGAHAFTQLSAKPVDSLTDRTCFFDKDAGLIHLYAMKYSTYAITYTTESGGSGENPGGGGGSSGGSSGGSDYSYYYITLEPGNGGSFVPNTGSYRVRGGKNAGFSIIPDTGYQIADVRVDGQSVGAVNEYTFSNVQRDHTLSAGFEKIPVTPDTPTPTLPTIPSEPDTPAKIPTPEGGTQSGNLATDGEITKDNPIDPAPKITSPVPNESGQIKKEVMNDIKQQREETTGNLPGTQTVEQRKNSVDEIDLIHDENAKPFVLLSFLLALLAVLFSVFNLWQRKHDQKSGDDEKFHQHSISAVIAALAAVVTFLLTTGWHGIILLNWWTILVAFFTALTVIISLRDRSRKNSE